MHRYLTLMIAAAALTVPAGAFAQDRDRTANRVVEHRYEDRAHNDSHNWNDNEDRAYRRYLDEHHKKYREFSRSRQREQQDYWNWRHSHRDDDRR